MRLPLALATSMFAVSLVAQQQQAPVIAESIEVRVTNVEVVVTDRSGVRVHGLAAPDFEIYENGVLQPLTNFYEYADPPEEGATSDVRLAVSETEVKTPPRRVVLFIDRVVLNERQRESIFNSYQELIDRTLRPGDEAMIVTYNTSLQVAVEFTSSKDRLKKAIASLARGARTNWERDELRELENLRKMWESTPEFDVEGHMATSTRNLAMQRRAQLKNRIQSLNALMTSVAGLEGRKVLILSSDRFTRLVGLDLFMGRADSGPPPPDATEFNAELLLRSLSSTANATGFTIYPFHPRGLKGTMSSAEFEQESSISRNYVMLQNDAAGMDYLAKETGGLIALGAADVQESIVRVADDLSSYYSLGYRSNAPPGQGREISVKVKRPGLTARTRRSMLIRSTEAEMGDRVIANLFRRIENEDGLKIRVNRGDMTQKGANVVIPVRIQIPIGSLTALPIEGGYGGSISLYVASADPRGGYSNVIRQTKPFTIRKEDLAKARKGHFTYEIDVTSNGAKVSVAVVDEISKAAGFGLIDVPAVAQNRPGPKGITPSAKTPAEKRGPDWKF